VVKAVKVDEEVDVLIIGGGLVGMALLHALKSLNLQIKLVEAKPPLQNQVPAKQLDTRSIALSPSSIRLFQRLGLWTELEAQAAPIKKIHISEQGKFGQAYLEQENLREPLGAVAEITALGGVLASGLQKDQILAPATVTSIDKMQGTASITLADDSVRTLRAKIIVACDGTHSKVRTMCGMDAAHKSYANCALATNVELCRPHHHIAYERFTQHGPMALLPLQGNVMGLVWTLTPLDAKAYRDLSDSLFIDKLQQHFGYRVGRFKAVGQRQVYPLQQMVMPTLNTDRVVFIGNAAHTLHPVAGQGFNLGLRDVAMLTELIQAEGLSSAMLSDYAHARQGDLSVISKSTDGLVRLFESPLPGLGLARRLGLVVLDNSTFLKRLILRHAKGFGGVVSELICEQTVDV